MSVSAIQMKLVIYLFLSLCPVLLQAQYHLVADTLPELRALDLVYQNQFDKYHQIDIKSVDTNTQRLLEIFYLRWKEIPVSFSAHRQHYLNLLLANAGSLEKQAKSDLKVSYFKICTYLFMSEYYSSQNENWPALKYAQKAYPLLTEAIDKKYSIPEYQFIIALYKYYVEYYRQKSLFFRAALIPLRSGNKTEGLNLLKKCAESPSLIQTEARIFLAHLLLHYENKPNDALIYSERLSQIYPTNLKFKELHCENLIRCKKYSEAIPLVEILEKQDAFYFSGPGHFLRGLIEEEFYKNKLKARIAYRRCVEKDYKPIEQFQKKALQRMKDLD
jgi:hypothetical protein